VLLGFFLAAFTGFDDAVFGEENFLQFCAPIWLGAQKEFQVHAEVLEFLFLGVRMMTRASLSFSTLMRCSYQLIASASSISDVIMRAKVRVFWDNSWDAS
jgi:hypothetical protein